MEENLVHTIENNNEIGEVKIADRVVSVIAGLAAMEVEEVASLNGNITKDLVAKLTNNSLSRGVKSNIVDDNVNVDVTLNVRYGCNMKDTTAKVQEKIKTSIENMTGLNVNTVNAVQKSRRVGRYWRIFNDT